MIQHYYDLRYYTPRWYETFLLHFLPYQTTTTRHKTLVYKQIGNRKYVYQIVTMPIKLGLV